MIFRSFTLALTLLICSCASTHQDAQPWAPKWNEAIGHVDVRASRTAADAWQGASGVDVSTANRWAMDSYRWSRGDNIVGLVGGIVTHSIAKGQQSDFEEKNANILPQLQIPFGPALNAQVDATVKRSLLATSFRTRLEPPYQTRFQTDILRCGFQRVGLNAEDEVLLTPYVVIKISLLSENPARCYLTRTIHKDATATHQHPARAYFADPSLTTRALQAIMEQFEAQITGRLKQRLGE